MNSELARQPIYFDTSAWNALADHPEQQAIVARILDRPVIALISVISAGEVLRTPRRERLDRLRALMLKLHGDQILLEQPLTLAVEAARSFLSGKTEFSFQPTRSGASLLRYLDEPNASATISISAWLKNLDEVHDQIFNRSNQADKEDAPFDFDAFISFPTFLQLWCDVVAKRGLVVSPDDVARLIAHVDVWRALASSTAYMIFKSAGRWPKKVKGRARPGGPDLSQLTYLGVVEVFVSSDLRQLEAAIAVSKTLHYPRCVVATTDLIASIVVQRDFGLTCPTCGSNAESGAHAIMT